MRLILIIGGVFFILLSLTGIVNIQKEMEVDRYGELVKMQIIEIPNSCLGTKNKYHMKLMYKGLNFTKRISGNFCEEHKFGDWVELKHINGSDIVLFPYENPKSSYFSVILMGLFGFGIVFWYGILKKPLTNSKGKINMNQV